MKSNEEPHLALSKGVENGLRQNLSLGWEGTIFWTIKILGHEMIVRNNRSQNWVLT